VAGVLLSYFQFASVSVSVSDGRTQGLGTCKLLGNLALIRGTAVRRTGQVQALKILSLAFFSFLFSISSSVRLCFRPSSPFPRYFTAIRVSLG